MELFDNNASAIISSAAVLLGAIIAALVAAVSMSISNDQNKKLRSDQIDFEKWKVNREFFISKGELLFSELVEWSSNNKLLFNEALLNISGDKTYDDFLIYSKTLNHKESNFNIRLMIDIYFDGLLNDFNYLNYLIEKVGTTFLISKSNNGDSHSSIEEIRNISDEFDIKCSEMKKKVVDLIKERM